MQNTICRCLRRRVLEAEVVAGIAEQKWLGWVMLGAIAVGGWFALGFLKDLIFGPSFPHELSRQDAYIFGRVIAEDEGDRVKAMMVCSTVLEALARDVPDAFHGEGTSKDFMDGCVGGGPAKYDVTDGYRYSVHAWMEETAAP
ncbi:hypothetical protein [Streptomyces virginiae]|uniref:hypothetical protein n=1 Tax=Streptomyces virginiae TaxID=1961 RepID=UPI0036CB9047